MAAAKIRVYELARELGLTNKEMLDLAESLGIGVKSHSSSIEEAQADRARRKADQLGIRRDQQPEEEAPPAKAKKSTKKAAAAPAKDDGAPAEEPAAAAAAAAAPAAPPPARPARDPRLVTSRPASEQPTPRADGTMTTPRPAPAPAERPAAVPTERPAAAAPPASPPSAPPARPAPAAPPAPGARPAAAAAPGPAPSPPSSPQPDAGAPAGSPRPAAGGPGQPGPGAPGQAPRPPAGRPVPGGEPGARPAAAAAGPGPGAGAPSRPGGGGPPAGGPNATGNKPPAPPRPMSSSGKPIPPPPRPPMSASGKPIPPPPGLGGRRATPPAGRPGGGPGGGRGGPGGPGGPGGGGRPGGYSGRPGGGNFPRQSVPGAGVGRGGPGGGPGGRGGPGGGRGRPPQRRKSRRRRSFEELSPTELTTYQPSQAPIPEGEIVIERGISAQELGPKLNRSAADVVRFLFTAGEMVTATQSLTDDMIELFAQELGADVLIVEPGQQQELQLQEMLSDEEEEDEELLRPRPPVVTVMGHVDHGKTLLLDRIRESNVVAGEAGGITQHIGAYQVDKDGRLITFIDTPGHEAFTAMRARGADVTDIVILVVAADDGVMPTTVEAISHARAADVPMVVAINKIDRENADPTRVMQGLSEQNVIPEEWGGDTIMVQISALQNLGIDELLEQVLLVADLEELVANPEGRARGAVVEANLDVGRGPVATVLVEKGTLRVGDPMVAGAAWGRVRAMIDDKGDQVKEALPSMPVQVLGLSQVPSAGDEFRVAPDDKTARTVAEARERRYRERGLKSAPVGVATGAKLEDIFEQIQRGETATLNLILKADVQGSLEAVTEALRKLERDEVKLAFVHRAVGGITESDIQLAATSNATIIGFNVRPDRKAREVAEGEDVEIRAYEVIYKLLEDIEAAMVGMLAPEYEEVVTGDAEVREIFSVPRIGKIAGCYVTNGVITRNSKVRFLREGVIIWKGTVSSLKRFKDDVREVAAGFECGIGLSDFQDLKPGDVIETFEEREIPRT